MWCPGYWPGALLPRESTVPGYMAKKRAGPTSSLAGKELSPNLFTPCSPCREGKQQ